MHTREADQMKHKRNDLTQELLERRVRAAIREGRREAKNKDNPSYVRFGWLMVLIEMHVILSENDKAIKAIKALAAFMDDVLDKADETVKVRK